MTNWKPNDKQELFLKTLKEGNEGLTLSELSEKAGLDFATGCINPLITKGLVRTEEITLKCNVVRADNGKLVGHTNKKVKSYFLAKGE